LAADITDRLWLQCIFLKKVAFEVIDFDLFTPLYIMEGYISCQRLPKTANTLQSPPKTYNAKPRYRIFAAGKRKSKRQGKRRESNCQKKVEKRFGKTLFLL